MFSGVSPTPVFSIEVESLKPPIFRSLMYLLDYETCENFPSFRKSGIQIFHALIKIIPGHFPRISYLDLDGCCLVKRRSYWRFSFKRWILEESLAQRQAEARAAEYVFKIFENKMRFKIIHGCIPYYAKKFLKYCRLTQRCTNMFEAKRIYFHLTSLLSNSGCDDPHVTSELLETLFVSEDFRNYLLYESTKNIDYMEYIMRQARKIRFDFWGLRSLNPEFNEFPVCPVIGCLLTGHDVKMKILLDYGFQRIPIVSVINIYRCGEQNPLYRKYEVIDMLQVFGLALRLPERNWETYTIHRAFMIIEMMYTLCKAVRGLAYYRGSDSWINCSNLLWRSIPDPYFSLDEMKTILFSLAEAEMTEGINNACSTYAGLFFETFEMTLKPRRLQHLCRCAIRQCLKVNYSLPLGLDHLRLPTRIIAFLKLES